MSTQPYHNYGMADCRSNSNNIAHPYFYSDQACDTDAMFPHGDNRSYAAYATQGPYRGYYHEACAGKTLPNPACDLTILNAPTMVNVNCIHKCTTPLQGLDKQCQQHCIINSGNTPSTPSTPSTPRHLQHPPYQARPCENL